MVFHWSLSDSKSSQVSRTLLSILAVLNNVVVWMVSTRPPTSKSSSPFINPLVTVPKTPIASGIFATFIFHSFFNTLARSRYLYLFSLSFSFILWSAGRAKSIFCKFSIFVLLIIIRSGLLAEIRWSVWKSKSDCILYVLFSWTDAGLCIYHLFLLSDLNLLHTPALADGFHWSLSDSKSSSVSRILLGILTDINNVVVWMASTRPLIIIVIIIIIRVFHISVRWCAFSGVWVTASLLTSPGLFSAFWPFSIML